MRWIALLLGMLTASTVHAQQTSASGKDRTRYTVGYGYREGSASSPFSLVHGQQSSLGAGYLFAQMNGTHSFVRGETTALAGFDSTQHHRIQVQGPLANIFGFALEGGLDGQYFEQPTPVFSHERTSFVGNHRQGSALVSFMGGVGQYRATYVRGGIVGGGAYVEHTLDLYVDHKAVRSNRSEISSGFAHLYGLRLQAGTRLYGISLRAETTRLLVGGIPTYVLDDQQLFSFGVSYQTPWYIGFYAEANASTGEQKMPFLGNSLTFGITGHWPR